MMYKILRRNSSVLSKMLPIKQYDYNGALEALNNLQSNAQYIEALKIKNTQENNITEVTKFLNRCGISLNDLNKLNVIHIAGTNGKGTTCAYTENILRKHGFTTGFYSSPHLLEVRERIRINGKPISKETFASNFWKVFNMLDEQKTSDLDMPLYFRFLTIMALYVFLKSEVNVAILEVGIGGEYDCTNVVRNTVVAGITPLDLDHTNMLGNSIESIAWNKAGIFKKGALCFTAQQSESAIDVLRERSIERDCSLQIVDNVYKNINQNSKVLQQIHTTNANLAISISQAFIEKSGKKFDLNLAKEAIKSTYWAGRYEVIKRNNFTIYLDGAHTIESIKVCSMWFKENIANKNSKKALIFNITGDRNSENMMEILNEINFDHVFFVPNVGGVNDNTDNTDYITTVRNQIEKCKRHKLKWLNLDNGNITTNLEVLGSVSKVFEYLGETENCDVLITGSIHLIGAAMNVLDPTLRGTLNE